MSQESLGGEDHFFGRIVAHNRLATQEQVDECQKVQESLRGLGVPKPLGEIMQAKGYLNVSEVEEILELQQARLASAETTAPEETGTEPASSDLVRLEGKDGDKFGAIVIGNGLLSAGRVDECLDIQRQAARMGVRLKIAEIMVQKGYLTERLIQSVLSIQRARRQRHGKLRPLYAAVASGIAAALLAIVVGSSFDGSRELPSIPDPGATPSLEREIPSPVRDGVGGTFEAEARNGGSSSRSEESGSSAGGAEGSRDPVDPEEDLFPEPPEEPGERELFPDDFRDR